MPAYAYGSSNVIFVVGAQKIVKNVDEGIKRIYEYCLDLESERARRAYGVPGSSVNKILIINKEFQEKRITLIFVNELLFPLRSTTGLELLPLLDISTCENWLKSPIK